MRRLVFVLGILIGPVLAAPAAFAAAPFSSTIPNSFGINIHFTRPVPGEMDAIVASGVKWIRTDLIWDAVEREPGRYDFSDYDHLVSELEQRGLKALFILDYGNPNYDGGLAPHSPQGRAAFARFAAAAVNRYRGKGYLWEIWNEPNLNQFWRPKANVEAYLALAAETTRAIQQVAPDESLIGPASSHLPGAFLDKVIRADFFPLWSGISVHPYRRGKEPESVAKDYSKLRQQIAKHRPGSKIPILSGEWGYSTLFSGMNEVRQGKFLARMWLVNIVQGVPLSIWYDWRNGPDPKEKEHNFGMVAYRLESKPAYQAATALNHQLAGFNFVERINLKRSNIYLLAFSKCGERRYAIWSTTQKPGDVEFALPAGSYDVFDFRGERIASVASEGKLSLKIDDGPRYLVKR